MLVWVLTCWIFCKELIIPTTASNKGQIETIPIDNSIYQFHPKRKALVILVENVGLSESIAAPFNAL